MTAQHTPDLPLALGLANWLESVSTGLSANQAAAELRRLHAASERLAALEAAWPNPERCKPYAWTVPSTGLFSIGPKPPFDDEVWKPLFIHPATPLSNKQIHNADPNPNIMFDTQRIKFARAIEQAHGIGVKK